MYLRFQIILSFGLLLSTSADIKIDQVINYLSSKNLPQAQNAFHNCIANLNINGFEQMNYDEFNQFLSRLGDDIISREIQPKEMSQKIIEFLKLDKSIITEKFEDCCKIFHSSLFAVEYPEITGHLKTFRKRLNLRFYRAYKILRTCINMYSLDGHDTSEMNVHEGELKEDERNDVRKCIIGDIIKMISGKIPLDGVVRGVKFFIFGSDEIPFAEYCCAAFYTYLVLDDSMFSGLILSTSAGIKLNKVINYLSSKNLPQAQNAFHNCIANLNINGFEQMNYGKTLK
ncbi:uncharacterized protein LOC126909261 isoform X2 [Daktulosphaira vitifoliae]|nr:uncharacterized protein LOC126909261 isoform X2 [Daktulosphaira vitifoliae]